MDGEFMVNKYKEVAIVNGKIVKDNELEEKINKYGQTIRGHYGKFPVFLRRTFKQKKRGKKQKTRGKSKRERH